MSGCGAGMRMPGASGALTAYRLKPIVTRNARPAGEPTAAHPDPRGLTGRPVRCGVANGTTTACCGETKGQSYRFVHPPDSDATTRLRPGLAGIWSCCPTLRLEPLCRRFAC